MPTIFDLGYKKYWQGCPLYRRQAERDRERSERLKAQEAASNDPGAMDQPEIEDQDSGLVETPEEKPKRERKPRAPRKPKVQPDEGAVPDAPEAAE